MKIFKASIPIISVVSLALIVRIVYNVTIARDYQPIFDAGLYDMIARHLINEHCFCLYASHPTVSRSPLWPAIIAIIYTLTGQQEFYARLFYCFLGSGTCVLIYLFARDLFGRRAALFSGLLAATYTGLFIWDGWLYSESLYIFCTVVFIYSLYRLQYTPYVAKPSSEQEQPLWRRQPRTTRLRLVIQCGIFLALAALTRPNGIFLLFLVYLWGLLVIRAGLIPWKIVVRDALIITCITTLIIAPWSYRNYNVTRTFVFVSTGLGEVLNGAYNDQVAIGPLSVRGMWRPPAGSLNHDNINYTPANDKADTQHALNWIHTHVPATIYLLWLHFTNTWTPYTYSHGLPIEESLSQPSAETFIDMINIMTWIVYSLASFGLVTTWKRWKLSLLPIYLFICLTLFQNVIFYGDMRFRSPLEPFLVLLAGGAIWYLKLVATKHMER